MATSGGKFSQPFGMGGGVNGSYSEWQKFWVMNIQNFTREDLRPPATYYISSLSLLPASTLDRKWKFLSK